MRVAMEVEFAAAELAPQQSRDSEGHDAERDEGLPVHAANIVRAGVLAMGFSGPRGPEWRDFAIELSPDLITLPLVSGPTFSVQRRVTYADCPVGNQIHYPRYLELLEGVRREFLQSLDLPQLLLHQPGLIFPAVEAHLRQIQLAQCEELLQVEVWITAAESDRLNFAYRITKKYDVIVLEGETRHVCMTLEEQSWPLPEEFVAAVKPYLNPPAS